MKKSVWVMVSVGLLTAASAIEGASTSGGIILKEGLGSRAQGMGEAFTGVANDVTSLYWNVAGLSEVKDMEAAASYLIGIADSAQQQLAFAYGLEGDHCVGLTLSLLQGGLVELDQPDGGIKKVQSQSDLAVSAGYGIKFSKTLSLGAAAKLLSSNLAEEYSAMAVAADLGAQVRVNEELMVGATLQNLGTKMKYIEEADPLPLTARIGAGYSVPIAPQHNALLAADLVKTNDHDAAVHMGVEYLYQQMLAARLGYKAGYDLEGLTVGIGVHYDMFQLDYALSLISELNSTHKITLTFAMDKPKQRITEQPTKAPIIEQGVKKKK